MRQRIAVGLSVGLAIAALGAVTSSSHATETARPNVVVIMADDMRNDDLYAKVGSKPLMPATRSLILGRGVNFTEMYTSEPLSCPSRTTFLTGQYPQNHGIRMNHFPGGEYCGAPGRFPMHDSLAPWLNAAGYRTIIAGRYLNGYPGDRPVTTVDPGWDRWFVPTSDAGIEASRYYGYILNENGSLRGPFTGSRHHDPRVYFTNVITQRVVQSIEETPTDQPVFAYVAHRAPHEDVVAPDGPEPAPRHLKSMGKIALPHTKSFDEANVSDKPKYVRWQPRLSSHEKRRVKQRAKRRLASLRAVDDSTRSIVAALSRTGRLDDTYILFVSDNGFFLGEHRFPKGKVRPYEPASRVPLVITGPGLARGRASQELVSNADLAPTILDVAGLDEGSPDGRSLISFAANPGLRTRRPVVVEAFRKNEKKQNIRTVGTAYRALVFQRYKLIRYTTGERELYDLKKDPNELKNIAHDSRHRQVVKYLSQQLKQFGRCTGDDCRREIAPVPKPHR